MGGTFFQKIQPWNKNEKYEGDEVDGKPLGHGKCTFSNGDTYEGEWELGKRYGHGLQK